MNDLIKEEEKKEFKTLLLFLFQQQPHIRLTNVVSFFLVVCAVRRRCNFRPVKLQNEAVKFNTLHHTTLRHQF